MPKNKFIDQKQRPVPRSSRRWLMGGLLIGLLAVLGGWWVTQARAAQPKEAPEAQKILDIQAGMPFQVLIPAYLPKEYDRANVDVQSNLIGPGGEPMVQLTYKSEVGEPLFIKEWVPVNPDMEILAASRPVETKWGKGWLLKQGDGLLAIWIDVGPLRASIFTPGQALLDKEHLLAVADNMGPASNRQVFNFIIDPPQVREVEPPPPLEIPINAEGVQEIDLIITPGGYSPLRFAVKKGVPVRLTFRQLGQVGCGNELNFPTADGNTASLKLKTATDKQVLEFTPQQTGEFEFFCGHFMYRGRMYVQE